MFKLVVLCAALAAVAAEPGALLAAPYYAPLTYSSTLVAPATTTITKQASSVVHPTPYYSYSTPYFGHYLKKRSAPLLPYYAAATYVAPALHAPIVTPVVRAPLFPAPLSPAPLAYSAPVHFIKKRSAPLLAAPYIASPLTYSAPFLPSSYSYSYSSPALPAAPVVAHAPLAYTHLIKKRSAPFLATTYVAPTSYSHQSRVDVRHSAPLITSYAAPFAYSSPVLTHYY